MEYTYIQIPGDRFDEIVAGTRREDVCRGNTQLEVNQRLTLTRCDNDRPSKQHSLDVIVTQWERIRGKADILPPGYAIDDCELCGLVKFVFELDSVPSVVTYFGSRQIVLGGM